MSTIVRWTSHPRKTKRLFRVRIAARPGQRRCLQIPLKRISSNQIIQFEIKGASSGQTTQPWSCPCWESQHNHQIMTQRRTMIHWYLRPLQYIAVPVRMTWASRISTAHSAITCCYVIGEEYFQFCSILFGGRGIRTKQEAIPGIQLANPIT